MKSHDTLERLFDAAEELFAEKGVRQTSLREITGLAGVNLASVNYYFGSKLGLIEAVLRRRLDPLNTERLKRLSIIEDNTRGSGTSPDVRGVMRAIFEPILTMMPSEAFLRLIARSMTDPDETVKEIFLREIKPVFQLMFKLLKDACPHVPEDCLFWRVQFALGAMAHSLWGMGRIRMVPLGVDCEISRDRLLELWLDFVTHGIEAPYVE